MSDLISRSKVISVLKQLEEHSLTGKMDISNAIYLLKIQKTAYSDDKVVEELKAIKEMDLSIPQHFTKEQSGWIKAYCIKRNIEFYNKAIDDFVRFANTMPTVEEEDGCIRPMWLEEMAEKLKAGGENEI